jgi:hypothetical protein
MGIQLKQCASKNAMIQASLTQLTSQWGCLHNQIAQEMVDEASYQNFQACWCYTPVALKMANYLTLSTI